MATNSALTDPICQVIKNQCGGSLSTMRDEDKDTRLTSRKIVFDAIVLQLSGSVNIPLGDIEPFKDLLRFFRPLFAGAGKEPDNNIQWGTYNALASTFHKHFTEFCCFLEILENVYGEKFPLSDVILEMIDPLHRPGSYLWRQYLNWDHKEGFFTWLDSNDPNYARHVQYHLDDAAIAALVAEFEDGNIYVNGALADSTNLEGKRSGHYAFALLNDGRLLLRQHEKGVFQHSSFTSGGPVFCTGMVKIVQGKITKLTNHSGHYRPEKADLRKVIENIPATVFAPDAEIIIETNRIPNCRDALLTSNSTWLKFLGHGTRDVIHTESFRVGENYSNEMMLRRFDGESKYAVEDIPDTRCCGLFANFSS